MRKDPSPVISEAPREVNKETLLSGTSEGCPLTCSPRKCLNRVLFAKGVSVKIHKPP